MPDDPTPVDDKTDPKPPAQSLTLSDVLRCHDIELPQRQVEQLGRYCQLLWQWNQKLNLTRHTDYEKFVARDLIDAMELSACLEPQERVLDVGSGGGLPGVPLAILRPDLKITLIDSVGKKVRALEAIIGDLGLPVRAIHDKVQHHLAVAPDRYDTLVARAIGRMDEVLRWLEPHWSHFDRLLLFKGPRWVEERGRARHIGLLKQRRLRRLRSYRRPGLDGESVILEIRPAAPEA